MAEMKMILLDVDGQNELNFLMIKTNKWPETKPSVCCVYEASDIYRQRMRIKRYIMKTSRDIRGS